MDITKKISLGVNSIGKGLAKLDDFRENTDKYYNGARDSINGTLQKVGKSKMGRKARKLFKSAEKGITNIGEVAYYNTPRDLDDLFDLLPRSLGKGFYLSVIILFSVVFAVIFLGYGFTVFPLAESSNYLLNSNSIVLYAILSAYAKGLIFIHMLMFFYNLMWIVTANKGADSLGSLYHYYLVGIVGDLLLLVTY